MMQLMTNTRNQNVWSDSISINACSDGSIGRKSAIISSAMVGTAGMIMLAMVLTAMGIDVNLIMIIYGIDRLFDMGRTALNVTGDVACAVCVSKWEKGKAKVK